jgi:hypothetical protein
MGLLLIWCQVAFDSWLGNKEPLLIDVNGVKYVMKRVSMVEEPNVRLAKLKSVGFVFVGQDRLGGRAMQSKYTFLLPLPQCCLGDVNSMRRRRKGPAFLIRNCLHVGNLGGVINLLPTTQRLPLGHIHETSTVVQILYSSLHNEETVL